MATVRKLRGKWYLDYRDARGKRRRVRAGDGTLNKKQAEKELREKLDQVDRGGGGSSRQRLKTYAERWLKVKRLNVKAGTYSDYKTKLNRYILVEEWGLADVQLDRLNKAVIEDWLLRLRERHEGLSNATVNAILGVLGNVLEGAVDDGVIVYNPSRKVKRLPKPPPIVDWLTPDEVRELLPAARLVDPLLELLIRVALCTGIRRGELLALRWLDVDLVGGRLFIRRSWRAGVFGDVKSARSRRPVELPPGLVSQLREHKLASGNPGGDELVFSEDGEVLEPKQWMERLWKQALRGGGLRESLRWHDLRHTFASLLLDQGESVKLVQSQLGHASGQITMDIYAHLMPEAGAGAAKRLEVSIIGNPTGEVDDG